MVNMLDEAMRENAEIPPESDATNSRLVPACAQISRAPNQGQSPPNQEPNGHDALDGELFDRISRPRAPRVGSLTRVVPPRIALGRLEHSPNRSR